jgi:hypothetical protein
VIIVKRLLTHPIPSQEKLILLPVIEGEGEHPIQGLEAFDSFFFIEVDNDFRIRTG